MILLRETLTLKGLIRQDFFIVGIVGIIEKRLKYTSPIIYKHYLEKSQI